MNAFLGIAIVLAALGAEPGTPDSAPVPVPAVQAPALQTPATQTPVTQVPTEQPTPVTQAMPVEQSVSTVQSPPAPTEKAVPTTQVVSPAAPVQSGEKAGVSDGQVEVRVTLDPPEIPFHRQAKLSIIVEAPNDLEIKFPNMIDHLGGLTASNVDRNTEILKKGRRRLTETYTLDPVFVNTYRIEPVTVSWGDKQSVTVTSPALKVRDLTEDEKKAAEEFVDIAAPVSLPHPLWRYRWSLITLGVLLGVVVIGVIYFIRLRQKRAVPVPPPPPWETAYDRLRDLDLLQLPQKGMFERYYVELTGILRRYIEDRFHLRAPEETTPEFLAEVAKTDLFDAEHQRVLSGFLRHCDRVKFAQYEPTINEMEKSFAFVLRFVDETALKSEAVTDTPSEEIAVAEGVGV